MSQEDSSTQANGTREEIVSFNVGGFSFETKKSTLCRKHSNGKPSYFELIIECKEHCDKDQDGFYFIDSRITILNRYYRDGDCMRVLLGYLRTNEIHIPKFLSPSAVKREARFYNIETPKIETPRDSPRKSVSKSTRLRKHGIYTSDITKLYLKVIASGSLLRGEDYLGKPGLAKKISYEIRGDQLVLPDFPEATRFILNGGNMILSSNEDPHAIPTMYFAPTGQILKKEIVAKFPFSVKDHGSRKVSATMSVLGLNVKVVMPTSDGELVVKSVAEQSEEGILSANLTLYSAKFIVEFYGHFVHVRNIAKDTVRRVPQATLPKEDR